MWGWVGLYGRPPSPFISLLSRNKATSHPLPREAIKASPTDHLASYVRSWLRLILIGRPTVFSALPLVALTARQR